MDLYTQLQDKLHDLTRRFAQEARYFQERAPSSGWDDAKPARLPLVDKPFQESRETLGLRAGCAARCILALNQQVDLLLSSLPADEGDEHIDSILDALNQENALAGEELGQEAVRGEKLLLEIREALHTMCPSPSILPPQRAKMEERFNMVDDNEPANKVTEENQDSAVANAQEERHDMDTQ